MKDIGSAQTEHAHPVATQPADDQGRIILRLRIGIAGHRDITCDHPGLVTEIANSVEYITQLLATDPDRVRSGDTVLTAVSSLAEGVVW